MNTTSETLTFMSALAEVRRAFLEVKIFMGQSGLFTETSMSVYPVSAQSALLERTTVSLHFYINGELNNWTDPDRKALGLSLAIVNTNSQWTLEREYIWSGQGGSGPFDSSETPFDDAPELIRNLPELGARQDSCRLNFKQLRRYYGICTEVLVKPSGALVARGSA